jgi:hypothetical protein
LRNVSKKRPMKTHAPIGHVGNVPGAPDRATSAHPVAAKVFSLFLIKPSHYDDDGYVIQWAKSSIPSNTLATLYGLALDCVERRVLGDEVEIRVTALDETNTRIRPERIIREIQAGSGLVCLVGVQTNQFPALWIWRGLCGRQLFRSASAASCQRLPGNVAGDSPGTARGDGSRHHSVRRRG